MGLFRFFAIVILVYLIVRFFRILLTGRRADSNRFKQSQSNIKVNKSKIIPDDEGEYVDYEDVDIE